MKILGQIAIILALTAVSACNKGFGRDIDDAASAGQYGTAGAGAGAQTGAGQNDPTTAAYFQNTVGDRVLFRVDESTLTPEAQTILTAQAAWLNQNTGFNAKIEGHADEQGTREYNLALGARRANEVRDFLVGRGVAANRIQVVSFGKERPLEICSEESCYAKNRRAVTVLATGLTG